MIRRPLAQTLGRPTPDQQQSVAGDEYEFTGFIDVVGAGVIHYSFKGPALTGQSFTAPGGVIPVAAGTVDIDFPVRFTERPIFRQGFDHGDNPDASALTPMIASVVSWKQGRRDETGIPFYDGARIRVVAVGGGAAPAAPGASYALYESSTGISATDNNSTVIPFDTLTEEFGSHGIVKSVPPVQLGRFTLPPGLYVVAANILFAPNATGYREIHFSGTVSLAALTFPAKHQTAAVAEAFTDTSVAITSIVRSAPGADLLFVYGLQNSGGALNVVGRSISFLRSG